MEVEAENEYYFEAEMDNTPEREQCLETEIQQPGQVESHDQVTCDSQGEEEYPEEVADKRTMNLKCQIDTEKLVREEAKQLIFVQEQNKLSNSTISRQISELECHIRRLESKIDENYRIRNKEQIETDKDRRKMIENKEFAQSMREIFDSLNNYIGNFEERLNVLKTVNVKTKAKQKYESCVQIVVGKAKKLEKLKAEINEIEASCRKNEEISEFEMKSLLEENRILKEQEIRYEKEKESRKIELENLKLEIAEVEEENAKKKKDNEEAAELLKNLENEAYDLKLNDLENSKILSLEKQKMEFERDSLSKSIESSLLYVGNLEGKMKKVLEEKITLEEELNVLKQDLNLLSEKGVNLEELTNLDCTELEQTLRGLMKDNEELKEKIDCTRKKQADMIQINHDEKLTLLKNQHLVNGLELELMNARKISTNEASCLERLKIELSEMEKEVENMRELVKKEKESNDTLNQNEENFKMKLDTLESDLAKQNNELDYQNNTLKSYLENKLQDLNQKLIEVDMKNAEKKRKFQEVEAINKKKHEQLNRVKKLHFMLTGSPKQNYDSTIQSEKSSETEKESEEKIEAEQPANESGAKSILKSSSKLSAPVTPTKSVTFVGVPSLESTSSSDMVNANNVISKLKEKDPFDELVQNKFSRRRKSFD